MAKRLLPDAELLRQFFRYEPETGKLYRTRSPSWPHCREVKTVSKDGYMVVGFNYVQYKTHRLVWALHYGEWLGPGIQIDHIDGNQKNNKIDNLRAVSALQNCRNKKLSVVCKSGISGVYWVEKSKKWLSRINGGKRQIILGYFDHMEDAIAARRAAEIKYNYHPNHGRSS